jgi:hypothetical protein
MKARNKKLWAFRALYRAVGNLSLQFYDAARRASRSEADAALWASASLVRALTSDRAHPDLLWRITAAPFPPRARAVR